MVTCSESPNAVSNLSTNYNLCIIRRLLSFHKPTFPPYSLLLRVSVTTASSILTSSLVSGQIVRINRNFSRHSMYCPDNVRLSNVISSTVWKVKNWCKTCENLVHIASTIDELQHTTYLKPVFLNTFK